MTTPAGRTPLDHLTSDELDELYDRLADYENRITWHATCGSCARILDSSIRETERAERAETTLDRIAALAAEHPAGIDTALVLEALDQTPRTSPNNPATSKDTP